MKIHQVAAQLFTVRDICKTPADIAVTLKKIRGIGYQAIQASGIGPIAEEELVRICREEGLTICATHEPPDKIIQDPQAVVARLKKLGCRHTAYPWPAGVDLNSVASIQTLAAQLNASGKVLYDAGLSLSYHNHSAEFRRVGGRTVLEIIYAETDPRYLGGEIDTYWVQHGGGDPVAWCQRLKGRLPLLHLKDYGVDQDNKVGFTEIGNGNLNWPAIISAAEAAGCEWFIVEQDSCPGDPLVSLRQSFEYIHANLCVK
jgi:sugar phosphate isomerase/epimerase